MHDPIEAARQRIATLLSQSSQNEERVSTESEIISVTFSEIMQELEIAGAELRRQNEELIEMRDQVEYERRRYQELFEYAPDAYLVTDAMGLIREANEAAGKLLNVDKQHLSGKPILVFISEEDLTQASRIVRSAEGVQDVEICIRPRQGAKTYVSITTNVVFGKEDRPEQIRWIMRNITERRKALAALDASEQRFRTIFDQSSLGIVQLDLNGKIQRANRAFLEMLGRRPEEAQDHFFSYLDTTEEEGQVISHSLQSVVHGRYPVPMLKTRLRRSDDHDNGRGDDHSDGRGANRVIWAGITLSPMRSQQNRVQGVIAMVENITAEQQAEAELAEMRRRLLESGEAERLRLAQDLHDGPMQDLYGAVFHLSNTPGINSSPDTQVRIKEVQEILRHVAGTLRAICGELRPPTLSNLGLERAIRSHAEQVQELHPEIKFQLQLTHEPRALPEHVRMALFRIYQQCMTNILRHAQAGEVLISFHVGEAEAVLDVWDNGKGFTLPEKWVELLREGHYGLAGIAERVEAINGVLKIDTKPGAGTLVHVSAPLPPAGDGSLPRG